MANAPKTDREKLVSGVVQRRYRKIADSVAPIFDEVEVYNQMYRAFMDQNDTYPWDYNLVDPMVFQLLRNMMSRLNPANMRIELDARNRNALDNRDINQALVNWELEEMQKTLIFYRFIFRGLLAGRSYLGTGWKFNKAIEVQYGEKGKNEKKKIMRDMINRADCRNIRFQDIFVPNQNNPEIMEQPYYIERMALRVGEMMDDNEAAEEAGLKPKWKQKYIDKIIKGRKFTNKMDYSVDLPQDDSDQAMDKDTNEIFVRSQYISVLRMQTLDNEVFYTPEKEDGWILNESEECEYWHGHYPLISFTPFPEDDEYYSMGIVQPVGDLQIAASSALNQFLTTARKAANPMWIKGSKAAMTPNWQFVNRPDGIIEVVGDIDQIKQIKSLDTSETMIRARQEITTTFEKSTGMSSLYQSGSAGGSSPQVNKTATGARIIDANLDINIQMIISIFGSMALSVLGTHFLELNTQYIDEEQEFKLTGEKEFRKAKPEEVSANFNTVVNADTITKVSTVVRQAQLLNFKGMVDQEKDIKINKKPIWEEIVRAYPELTVDPSELFTDPVLESRKALAQIMAGDIPEVTYDQDHKAMITIIQAEVTQSQEKLTDKQLKDVATYLDDHRKFQESEQNPDLITLRPPAPQVLPPDQAALMAQMGGVSPQVPGMPGAQPGLPPGMGANMPPANPTQGQTVPIPAQLMGA